jgi:hypothetical protein
VNRHATVDELARLGADDLRPRKAARIGRHLTSCTRCTRVSDQLAGVPALLSSVSFPKMPQNLSARIDSALAAESAQRVAAEPATEAGRGELPAWSGRLRPGRPGSGGPRRGGQSWRLPVPATRVVATAAAILVVGVSGYEIAAHAGAGAPAATSSGAGAKVPAPVVSQVSVGPQVSYRQAGTENSIRMLTSGTNFRSSTLAEQAAVAVREAKIEGIRATPASSATNSGLSVPTSSANPDGALGPIQGSAAAGSQLSGCIDHVVNSGQVVIMVERAKFEGARATIIVAVPTWARSTSPPKDAEVWAVGEACSATDSHVLDHVRVARL